MRYVERHYYLKKKIILPNKGDIVTFEIQDYNHVCLVEDVNDKFVVVINYDFPKKTEKERVGRKRIFEIPIRLVNKNIKVLKKWEQRSTAKHHI